jgi:hypothetical protein
LPQDNAQQLLQLSANQLLSCSSINSLERKGGSLDNTRTLLTLSLQVCLRDNHHDDHHNSNDSNSSNSSSGNHMHLAGDIYRRLVEISASRRQAIETIEEFTQLVQSAHLSTEGGGGTAFKTDDIDHIAVQAYNYAVTLSELEDVQLAERFASQSLILARFASPRFKEWVTKMQVRLVGMHNHSQNVYLWLLLLLVGRLSTQNFYGDLLKKLGSQRAAEKTPNSTIFGELL